MKQGNRELAFPSIFSLMLLVWLSLGFFRMYLFPNLSNVLYFFPAVFLFYLFLSMSIRKSSIQITIIVVPLFFLICIWQFYFIITGKINFVTGFYGIYLYAFPSIYFYFANSEIEISIQRNFGIFFLFIVANTTLVILQTYTPVSKFAKSINESELMTSSSGYFRAYGTFSHPSGFVFFLTIALGFFLGLRKWKYRYIALCLVFSMIILSGSRAIIFQASYILLSVFFVKFFQSRVGFSFFSINYLVVSAFFSFSIFYIFKNNIKVFLLRFSEASNSENTIRRIVSNLFVENFFNNVTLLGHGLGSASTGATLYNYRFQGIWIENAISNNFYEGGLFLGIFFLMIRIYTLAVLVRSISVRMPNFDFLPICVALIPTCLIGPIFGQPSISHGFWICVALIYRFAMLGTSRVGRS